MKLAPWKDFVGNDIHEGDIITHPSGESGKVVFLPDETEQYDQWRVAYVGSRYLSRLCLQIGDRGQAVVAIAGSDKNKQETNKGQTQPAPGRLAADYKLPSSRCRLERDCYA